MDIQSKNTASFLNEISQMNTNLQNCPVPLNSAAKTLLGNDGVIKLTITMNDKSTKEVFFIATNGNLTAVSTSKTSYGFNIILDECHLDAILGSNSRYGAFAYVYTQGKLKMTANGAWNYIKFTVAKIFIGSAMKKAATPITIDCLKNNGAVCNHGGECKSGNCVGVGQGPPWTYQCSCDPSTYKENCPVQTPPAVNPSGKRPAGELCEHGGQCETGNCVGVGQGPPWTYRCSCDTSKFTTGC
ncbi:MAG: hypothetical protein ACP5NV_05785 [Candidatus Woesearchaeota archaeon]